MKIGAMNSPEHEVIEEIRMISKLGLEFVDLTLEPPRAASWLVDPLKIKKELKNSGLSVVGHTAYYLPLISPIEEIRQGALTEMKRCIDVFAAIGVRWVNLHPDRLAPLHSRQFVIDQNIHTLQELLPFAKKRGVGLMIENLPGDFNSAKQLAALLEPLPELGLHLDIGHANLLVEKNTTGEIVKRYGSRIRHVHLHDNKGGGADLHLPLGTGTVRFKEELRTLKKSGYDATITLEVFSPDRTYLVHSRDVLRQTWDRI